MKYFLKREGGEEGEEDSFECSADAVQRMGVKIIKKEVESYKALRDQDSKTITCMYINFSIYW